MPDFNRKIFHTVSEGKSAPVRNLRFGGPASGTSQDLGSEANGAQTQLMAAIDSVSEGFALFDSDDRMVFCNRHFREQNPVLALNVMPGMSFEEMLRKNIATYMPRSIVGVLSRPYTVFAGRRGTTVDRVGGRRPAII